METNSTPSPETTTDDPTPPETSEPDPPLIVSSLDKLRELVKLVPILARNLSESESIPPPFRMALRLSQSMVHDVAADGWLDLLTPDDIDAILDRAIAFAAFLRSDDAPPLLIRGSVTNHASYGGAADAALPDALDTLDAALAAADDALDAVTDADDAVVALTAVTDALDALNSSTITTLAVGDPVRGPQFLDGPDRDGEVDSGSEDRPVGASTATGDRPD